MYASHRDACILSHYASLINERLGAFYSEHSLGDMVIAYRSLGLSNYHFSATAYRYAVQESPCAILAFDVSGFFDNLDHLLLKTRLKRLLGVESLPTDWMKVFRFVSDFHYVELDDLKKVPAFLSAMDDRCAGLICTVADLKKAEIEFRKNKKPKAGIPQGTPISAALSNLYMIDFDLRMKRFCESIGALYRRYSDDILIICGIDHAAAAESEVLAAIRDEKLEISADKTEKVIFDVGNSSVRSLKSAQYLGFTFYPGGAGVRPGSLSRQWRKMKSAVRRTAKVAEEAIKSGKAKKAYTKKLRKRFSPLQIRNFSSYVRRSAKEFGGSQKMVKQVRRLEREFERRVRQLKALEVP